MAGKPKKKVNTQASARATSGALAGAKVASDLAYKKRQKAGPAGSDSGEMAREKLNKALKKEALLKKKQKAQRNSIKKN